MDSRERECVVDIEAGMNMSEGVECPELCAGKLDDSNKGENGVILSCNATNSGEILALKIERAKSEDLGEKKLEKEKRKSTSAKKPPKPPRPPRGYSLDAADQKLIKELHELAMMKRARIERMKALKKMKAAKASSVPLASNGSFFAMFFTVLFFLVLIFQGMSSRNSSPSFHGSPESGVAKESSLVFPQDRPNLSSSPSSTTGSGSPILNQSELPCGVLQYGGAEFRYGPRVPGEDGYRLKPRVAQEEKFQASIEQQSQMDRKCRSLPSSINFKVYHNAFVQQIRIDAKACDLGDSGHLRLGHVGAQNSVVVKVALAEGLGPLRFRRLERRYGLRDLDGSRLDGAHHDQAESLDAGAGGGAPGVGLQSGDAERVIGGVAACGGDEGIFVFVEEHCGNEHHEGEQCIHGHLWKVLVIQVKRACSRASRWKDPPFTTPPRTPAATSSAALAAQSAASERRRSDLMMTPSHSFSVPDFPGVDERSGHIVHRNLEDLGTEYLVRPCAPAEDEEDTSDFEPEENGEEDEIEGEEDDDDDDAGGKVEAPPKRKRSGKDDSDDDGGEDDDRPSKR
nr:PAB-dependent poly(A)-specific ribonuclease [Ipomoea batatas]